MVLATSGMFVLKSLLGAVVGFFLGLFIPHVVVRIMETRRKNKFASQLVDGIMVLSSSLKAGLSLLQSLEVLVEEMPPPISQELGLVVRENKMGVVLEDSLKSLNKRMGIEELELLVNALLVARETGGDLIKVFSRLTITIRDRQKLREKIKTLTLQGRLQGILMSALPFVFVAYVTTVNRSHFDIMLQTDNGRFLLILAVVLQAIGMFLIRKFSRIKI
jgi:tight adherence protein B